MSKSDFLSTDRQEAEQIQKVVLDEMRELKKAYIKERNKKARPLPLSPGDLCVIKDHKPDNNKEGAGKQKPAFRPVLYFVRGINGTLCAVEHLVTNTIHYVHTDHVKKYVGRDEYFGKLPEALQKRLGSAFLVQLDMSDRKALLSTLQGAGFQVDARAGKIPSIPDIQAADQDSSGTASAPDKDPSTISAETLKTGTSVTVLSLPEPLAPQSKKSVFGKIKDRLRRLTRRNYRE